MNSVRRLPRRKVSRSSIFRPLRIRDAYELADVPPHKVYGLVKCAAGHDADGIFVPCTTFPAIDIIDEAERDTGKPVITSNQALTWELLRLIGLDEPVGGFGHLLRSENRRSDARKR